MYPKITEKWCNPCLPHGLRPNFVVVSGPRMHKLFVRLDTMQGGLHVT